MSKILKNWKWNPPDNWLKIKTVDLHTGGEPLRVYTYGLPEIKGNTILEKRRYFRDNFDYIRTGTMFEPRGHADMYGAIITEPTTDDADVLGLKIDSSDYNRLIEYERKIKNTVMEQFEIKHPYEEDLSFLYVTIFTGKPFDQKNHCRNVCIFAEGEVDRSPTGSGVSARAALHFAKKN